MTLLKSVQLGRVRKVSQESMEIDLGKTGYIAEIGEARYVCRILVGEPLEKWPCVKTKKDIGGKNGEMDLRKIGYEVAETALHHVQWQA
jgi:hypothetical protein